MCWQGEESALAEARGKEHGRAKLQEQDQLIKDLKLQLKCVLLSTGTFVVSDQH